MKVDVLDVGLRSLTVDGFAGLRAEIERRCGPGVVPLRFVSVATEPDGFRCEIEAARLDPAAHLDLPSIFDFRRRAGERTDRFNAVMLVPTGIDCAVGGHAGDATPAARLLAAACDHLVLHPNVVNASDINEAPANALYVEGSQICRLLMGDLGLKLVRKNRILTITEEREPVHIVDQVVNCVSGARATLGIDCDEVVVLDEGLDLNIVFSGSGRATGRIGNLEGLLQLLRDRRADYDAVALATLITPPGDSIELHRRYFDDGDGPNPWGGAEAALTHTVSLALGVPAAHAPTLSDPELGSVSFGQVEPRKAAEVISTTYLFCVLKGLHRAPRLVAGGSTWAPDELHAEDVSALVIPDGTLGLPVLAALYQGIPVVAVRGNTSMMRNDLDRLPWAPGQLVRVDDYLQATGVLMALRDGVPLAALQRPMRRTRVVPVRRDVVAAPIWAADGVRP